jgi:hypothetical protein
MHELEYPLTLSRPADDRYKGFSIVLVGNQAEYSRLTLGLPRHGTCEQMPRFCEAA